jgi:hypothetical protein
VNRALVDEPDLSSRVQIAVYAVEHGLDKMA